MEEVKIEHSQKLAQFYWKELRAAALTTHRGQWIVMRTPEEFKFFTDVDMDIVFGQDWHYWDEFGCFCDIIGCETGIAPIKIGIY